jgi:hypothetical protein
VIWVIQFRISACGKVRIRFILREVEASKLNLEDQTTTSLPKNKTHWKYYKNAPIDLSGYEDFLKTINEISDFLKALPKK